jgi:hypothetical protein
MLNIPCLGLVPMTKTVLLGATLAAVFTVMLFASPMADAITGLVETEVKDNKNTYQKITFSLADDVITDGTDTFGGYAVFTDGGDVIAVTSHMGAYDSAGQQYDDPAITFALCSPEQLDAGLCGPEWHSHLVKPADSDLCAIAQVGALTFEEPSATVVANQDNIKVVNVKKGTKSFTNSVSGLSTEFTVASSAVDPHPLSGQAGVPFDLNPVFIDGALNAICIGPASEVGSLCSDLGDGTVPDAQDFMALHNTNPTVRLEIGEFPYSDDLWNEINIFTGGAIGGTVVGATELSIWYGDSCTEE